MTDPNPPPGQPASPLPVAANRFWALVPCAGIGSRAGGKLPKQYQPVAGQALVVHSLKALLAVPQIEAVLAVVAPADTALAGLTGGRPPTD